MTRYYSLVTQGPPAFVMEISGNLAVSHDGYSAAAVLCLTAAAAAEIAGALTALGVSYELRPLQIRSQVSVAEEE